MELILALAVLLAVNAYRDWKLEQRLKVMDAGLKSVRRKLHYVGDLAEKIEKTDSSVVALKSEIEPLQEFVQKASTDLATIVNEYKVNGIPLGLDRTGGRSFDVIEGL